MSSDSTPVLVGVAAVSQRIDDPRVAKEPVALMIDAVRAAAADAGAPGLLARADSIRVPRGFWEYSDPGRLVARAIAAEKARTTLAEIGVLQQTIISGACSDIEAGRAQVAIVTGGEAKYRARCAERAGVEAPRTVQEGEAPDVRLEPADSLWSEHEAAQGMLMPVQYYAIMENALRHADGQSIDAHRAFLGELYASFSRVAEGNPHAWGPAPVDAETIATKNPKNPMIAFPYGKLHNSSWNVDQAGALVFCSLGLARELGLDPARFVYPLAGTESNHMVDLSARPALHENVGVAVAGRRALELAGIEAGDLTEVELYSCFPAAVRIFARALGLDERGFDARPLTVTGGMPFAGGPLNNYVVQSTARMVERLRAAGRGTGLVTSVSGMITKAGFGVYATSPPARGFGFEDVTDAVAAATQEREIVGDYAGDATVAGYTVLYLGDTPFKGLVVCDLPDGRRSVASTEDAGLCRAMTEVEVCARRVRIEPAGRIAAIEGLG